MSKEYIKRIDMLEKEIKALKLEVKRLRKENNELKKNKKLTINQIVEHFDI